MSEMAHAGNEPKKILVVVRAWANSEYGDGPAYAAFGVTASLLDRLDDLTKLCESAGLTEVRFSANPQWGPGSIEDELLLRCGEMVVTRCGDFWFADYPKHSDYDIQTSPLRVKDLMETFSKHEADQTVYLTDDAHVIELFEEDRLDKEPSSPVAADRG